MHTDDTANSGSCGIDPNYNSSAQNLVASINRFAVLPAAIDPSISATSIPDGPATAGIVLDFSVTPGSASFNLDSSDVGQYELIISDTSYSHSDTTITTVIGDSALLTVKPFGLAVTNISAGATPNPGANTSGGAIFTSATSRRRFQRYSGMPVTIATTMAYSIAASLPIIRSRRVLPLTQILASLRRVTSLPPGSPAILTMAH